MSLFHQRLRPIMCLVFFGVVLVPSVGKPKPLDISGKTWTVIIAGGAVVLYEFGYQLPIDNLRIKGAWAQAENTIKKTDFDSGAVAQLTVATPIGFSGTKATLTVVAPADYANPGAKPPAAINIACTFSSPPPIGANKCYPSADGHTFTLSYQFGSLEMIKDIRAKVIQTVILTPKSRSTTSGQPNVGVSSDQSWRTNYTQLSSCWNRLIYADPSSTPTPSMASSSTSDSSKATPAATKTPRVENNPQAGPRNHAGRRAGARRIDASRQAGGVQIAARRNGGGLADRNAGHRQVAPTPTPTISDDVGIAKTSCAYAAVQLEQLEGRQDYAPAIISAGDSGSGQAPTPIYVDLADAAAAFDDSPSLRQQIIDRRVGSYTIDDAARAEVVAKLGGAFYAFNPALQPVVTVNTPTPEPTQTPHPLFTAVGFLPPATAAPTPAPTSAVVGVISACQAPFDITKCPTAIQGLEAPLAGNIATKNACAFAAAYWLPPVNTIAKYFAKEIYGSASSRSLQDPATDAALLERIKGQDFGPVPGC